MQLRGLMMCVVLSLGFSQLWSQTENSSIRVEISRDQSVSTLPPCLVLHKSGLFSRGQCEGVWIMTVNLDDKVLTYAAVYNSDLFGEQITTNFTLGQAIVRHSLAQGMSQAVLKRFANEEQQGLVDVANGILYDTGHDIGTSMPDAAIPIRTVKYLQSSEALVLLLKESDPKTSELSALTDEQFEALKTGIMKQTPPSPGPKLK